MRRDYDLFFAPFANNDESRSARKKERERNRNFGAEHARLIGFGGEGGKVGYDILLENNQCSFCVMWRGANFSFSFLLSPLSLSLSFSLFVVHADQ
jgi:hypothetical protein